MKNDQRTWLVAGLAAALGACSSGGGDDAGTIGGGTGTLSLALMDAPVDGVENVLVEIAGISVKPADGPPVELELAAAPLELDLLELTDENAAVLIDGAVVEAGAYEWIELDVNAAHDGVFDSYVVARDGTWHEIRVPSGRVRLVGGFDVAAGEAVRFLIDWDVRKALVDPPGLPGYLLRPAFRVLDAVGYGVITGSVSGTLIADPSCLEDTPDEADPDVGNVVYIFAGADVSPDDLDGTDDAVATAALVQDGTDYVFRAVVAPSATPYTVAWTCQAASDVPDEDDDIVFSAGMNVDVPTADTVAVVTFE